MPYAELMVETADGLGIDWRLLPAIAVHESSAGRAACGANAWGLGSCGPGYVFGTWEEGIVAAAHTLASPLYAGLSTAGILCRWVSGSAGCVDDHARAYAARVLQTMERLGVQ